MNILKKGLLLTLAYCMLVTQAFAVGYEHVTTTDYDLKAENTQLIKKAFDTYRYRMTVQWDQNDSTFKEFAKSEFEKDILELKSQGVTTQEIQAFMASNMLSNQARSDYKAMVSTLRKQGRSDEQIASVTGKFVEKNYQSGASYSGGAGSGWAIAGIIIAVVIITVVTIIVIREHHDNNDGGHHDRNGHGGKDCWDNNFGCEVLR